MTYATLLKEREKNKHVYCQDFTDSKENYCIEQYGEKYNLYQHIQNAREDTEIIPTLEKYGVAKGMEKLKRFEPENADKYYGDFSAITDMRNMMDKAKKADELWLKLPLEVRHKFGNSKREFYEKGGKWLKEQAEDYAKNNMKINVNNEKQQVNESGAENE